MSSPCTSSALLITSHPSNTNACSETAILTGAVRTSWSLSRISRPQASISPLEPSHSPIFPISSDFSLTRESREDLTSWSRSDGEPLPSGRAMVSNPADSRDDEIVEESSVREKTATMFWLPFFAWKKRLLPAASAAAAESDTVPTKESIES